MLSRNKDINDYLYQTVVHYELLQVVYYLQEVWHSPFIYILSHIADTPFKGVVTLEQKTKQTLTLL